MSKFDWNLAEVFLAVLDTGSLSAAARTLKSSQPTVGRQIKTLEDQLEATLFTRTGKELIATPLALDLAEEARAMQQAVSKISMRASGARQTLKGTVRITASEVMATYALPAIIAKLLDEEEGLEIELVASNSSENLALREADIAVRMHPPSQADLIARKIGDLPLGLFAHKDYLVRKGTPENMEDIRDHIFLGYDTSDLMINGMKSFGFEATRHDFQMRCDNQVTYVEAVAAGVGIGATSTLALSARKGVVMLFPQVPIPPLPMWLVAHQELKTSALVRFVYDRLARDLKELCAQETSKLRSMRQEPNPE